MLLAAVAAAPLLDFELFDHHQLANDSNLITLSYGYSFVSSTYALLRCF